MPNMKNFQKIKNLHDDFDTVCDKMKYCFLFEMLMTSLITSTP